jgi:hypothetical protein
MTAPVLDHILEAMELMARAEETVQRLYATCAVLWKEDEEFWRGLAGEERHDTKHVRSMIAILTANPYRFQSGRPFSALALKTFISGIERDIESLKQSTVPELKVLHLALDIEQAIIEARFTEIVQTEDKSFRALADEIMQVTAIHRRLVEKKITERQASSIGR